MGVLSTGVAVVSSTALPSASVATTGSRPETGVIQSQAAANAVLTGQAAAVVTLSGAPTERRSPTHGDTRMVDGSFDTRKNRRHEKQDADKAGVRKEGGTQGRIDVSA